MRGRNSVYRPMASPKAAPIMAPTALSWAVMRTKGCRLIKSIGLY